MPNCSQVYSPCPERQHCVTFCCSIRHHDCYSNSHTATLDRNNEFLFVRSQCAAVCMPNLSFTRVPLSMRWATFAPFQVSHLVNHSASQSTSQLVSQSVGRWIHCPGERRLQKFYGFFFVKKHADFAFVLLVGLGTVKREIGATVEPYWYLDEPFPVRRRKLNTCTRQQPPHRSVCPCIWGEFVHNSKSVCAFMCTFDAIAFAQWNFLISYQNTHTACTQLHIDT